MRQIPTIFAFLCLSTCLNGQSFSIELNEQVFYTNIRCKARWSRHFDGVIYIPEMKPATPLGESSK